MATEICLGLRKQKASNFKTLVVKWRAKRKGQFSVARESKIEELAKGKSIPEEFRSKREAVFLEV